MAYPVTQTVTPGVGGGETFTTSYRYYGVNAEPGQGSGLVGQLQSVTDPNGAVTRLTYDAFGRVIEIRKPDAGWNNPATETYAYTDSPAPLAVKHSLRDDQNGDTSSAATYLEEWTYYDGLGQAIQTQREAATPGQSIVASTQYHPLGGVRRQSVPYFYPAAGGTYRAPDWNQPKTQTTYDALGRPLVVTHPDGTTTETVYRVEHNANDPDFNTPRPVVYTIDANRRFVRRAFDVFGNLRVVSESTGSWPVGAANPTWGSEYRTLYSYDVAGRLTQVTDAANNQTKLTYDLLGRKTEMTDPDMGTWYYGYDAAGNLKHQIDMPNNLWRAACFYYDGHNRLKGKTYSTGIADPLNYSCPADPGSYSITYSYDSTIDGNQGLGRRTGMSDPSSSTSWRYDARGRVTRETRTVDGTSYVTDYAYDSLDRVVTMTYPADANGVREAVTHTYNPAAQLSQVRSTTHNLNYVSGLTYSALGQLTELTYGNNLQERRGYYGLGGNWDSRPGSGLAAYGRLWRIRVRTAAGTPLFDLRYNYDNVGNMTRMHEAPRQTANWPTTYTFQDPFNSKNTTAWTWSSQQTVPFNDGGNNVVKSTGTGSNWNANFYRNSTLTNGQGLSVRFKVDSTTAHALWAIETTDSARRFAIYATGGKLIVQYNDGGGWRYPTDLITALQANTWYVARIVIDDVRGFYLEVYQENAPTVRGSYQQWLAQGLAWRFRHWIYSGTAYLDDYREFSAAGITWTPDERMNFGYDALHRLISAQPDSGAQGYTAAFGYNAIGNLISKTENGTTLGYEYPPSGLKSVRPHAATKAGSNSYSYDNNGNMVTRTESGVTYSQTWDEENRLKTVTVNGQTTTFVYDGDGRRVKKVQNGQTTVYIGDYYEKNLSTGVVTKYYYANGQRVAQRQGSAVYYFTGDHLGSTSLVTDASGGEVARQKYYPFGTPRSASGTLPTDYRFTGQRSEEAALGSLYDYGARFYSPALGRFIQPDTIVPAPGNPQSLNRYAYVLNNALRYTDPTGMAECAAGDDQCWINEWHWKNRWYNAHGYFWGGGHWSVAGDPHFQDEGITDDVIVEAGISLASTVTPSPWSWANKQKVAYAVARFGQKLSGGIAALQALLGGYAVIHLNPGIPFYCQGACAPPPPWTGGHDVFFAIGSFSAADLVGGAQWVVHELAHVIDWQGGFSRRWPHGDLTQYSASAPNVPLVYRRSWERWAEAVTIWVFGSEDGQGGYVTSYKTAEVQQYLRVDYAGPLMERMRTLQSFLEGW